MFSIRRICACSLVIVSTSLAVGCSTGSKARSSDGRTYVVAAAGDISCDPADPNFLGTSPSSCQQRQTANLAVGMDPDVVLALGDLQYECGTADAFAHSYDISWGRLRDKTRPVIGNHEYFFSCLQQNNRGLGYFSYFGAAAGDPDHGYYSFDLGSWHVLALNSECPHIPGGCGEGSSELEFVRHELRSHPGNCTLVYWHEPRFSSGIHGDALQMGEIWNALVGHAAIVLNGHAHSYERFAPIGVTPADAGLSGSSTENAPPNYQQPVLDPAGIREFVVGTGGRDLEQFRGPFGTPIPALQGEVVRNDRTFGVLRLALGPGSYGWRFVPVRDGEFSDSGTGSCRSS
jgi:hypothetical protein